MSPTPQPKSKSKKPLIAALVILVAGLIILCCGLLTSQIAKGGNGDALTTPDDAVTFSVDSPSAGAAKKAKADVTTLTTKNIALAVKVKSKECYGSAGCNIEYTIKASVGPTVRIADPCDVTYEVKGFEDGTQVHTLTVTDDKTYSQDSYQAGSTANSAKKLTAKVTEVDCS